MHTLIHANQHVHAPVARINISPFQDKSCMKPWVQVN